MFMVASDAHCAECGDPAPAGYRIHPATQKPDQLRCRRCFEQLTAWYVRQAIMKPDYLQERRLVL